MYCRFDFAMSSKVSKKENGSSPVKQTSNTSEIQNIKKPSASEGLKTAKNSSFLSMFQNSNTKQKIQRQNNLSQPSDESLLSGKSKESVSEQQKEIGNKICNSTQPSDSNKMVVSFQSGNSGANHSLTNNSISCRTTNSALNFSASTNGSRSGKPAAGKVLKNGSSGNSASKGESIDHRKIDHVYNIYFFT